MENYKQEINLYFELKGTPESSRESYLRRIKAFITFIKAQNKQPEDITIAVRFSLTRPETLPSFGQRHEIGRNSRQLAKTIAPAVSSFNGYFSDSSSPGNIPMAGDWL